MIDVQGPALTKSPDRVGRYEILGELGRGGMAVLYLARTSGPGGFERVFAVKMIHPHLSSNPQFARMFLAEAQMAARIRHPNVVPVYEVDADGDQYFLTMEYVSGETLSRTLGATWGRGRPFPLAQAVQIVAQVADGLHAAHELTDAHGRRVGVVHRDVSPQNIMLGYDGTVRLTDFGVAKVLGQKGDTQPGTFKGKVAYTAPEQIRAASTADLRSDVFSLGVVLWEAVTGRRLFKAASDLETAERVLRGTFTRASVLRSEVPPMLDRVIEKALQPDPTSRHQSAREFADELRAVLEATGRRATSRGLEVIMRSVFADRIERRLEMERKAARGDGPFELTPPPATSESAAPPITEALTVDLALPGARLFGSEVDSPLAAPAQTREYLETETELMAAWLELAPPPTVPAPPPPSFAADSSDARTLELHAEADRASTDLRELPLGRERRARSPAATPIIFRGLAPAEARTEPGGLTPTLLRAAPSSISGTQLVRDTQRLRREVERWRYAFIAAAAVGVAGLVLSMAAVVKWSNPIVVRPNAALVHDHSAGPVSARLETDE